MIRERVLQANSINNIDLTKNIEIMKKIILVVLCCLIFLPSMGQNKKNVDSLMTVYKNARHDTTRILVICQLAYEYRSSNIDTVIYLAQQALNQSREIKFERGEAWALTRIATWYNSKGKIVEVLKYAEQARVIFEKIQDKQGLSTTLNIMGIQYRAQGNYPLALEYNQKALIINEEIKNQVGISVNLHNFGEIYIKLKNYSLALDYFQKSFKITEVLNLRQRLNTPLFRITDIYILLGKYDLALENISLALKISQEFNDKFGIATCCNRLGKIYFYLDKHSLALDYLEKSLKLSNETGDDENIIQAMIVLAQIYKKEKNYEKSLDYAQQGLSLAQQNHHLETVNILADLIYQNYKQTQNYQKALEYFEMHKLINDSIFNLEQSKAISNLETKASLDRKDLEIKKEKEARDFQRNLNYLIGLGMASVLIFAFFIYRSRQKEKKAKELVYIQKEELQQQAEELHQQAEELAAQRDSLEKANENVMLLSDIGKKITSSLQFKTIFRQLYENINQLMDATIFGVGIYERDRQLINYELAMERGVAYLPYTRNMEDKSQLAVRCIEDKKEILINDVSQHSENYMLKAIGELADGSESDEPQSLIYIPLLNNQEKVLGVMSVQSYQKDAYNNYQLNILRNLAIYTSIAIENAENLKALDDEKKNIETKSKELESKNQELEALTEELRQQTDTVQAQRDQLSESSTQLEELLEESQSQKEILEVRNQEMEALQTTKDLMISAVNHDLRNPLNPILNYSQADYPRFTEKERLAMIHDRAKMMFSLINDIMDVYRADKMQLQPQTNSLHKAVAESIATISEAKTDLPEISNEIPETAMAIFEYKYIERVLENLLSNAIKYSENKAKGGKVRFYTEALEQENKKYWRIAIADNGMGISKDKFEEIFLPFSNPNAKDIGAAKSVGIGLTFCKTILEAHGSQIKLDSQEGAGTTFWFDLPAPLSIVTQNELQTLGEEWLVDLVWTTEEKHQLQTWIAEIRLQKFHSANLRRYLQKLEVGKSENLQKWQAALVQAKEQGNEESFKKLLEL